jgi:signal peptide peptidase SppA
MNYERIAKAFYEELWAITRAKHAEIAAFIEFKRAGGEYTAEELRARFGEPSKPTPSKRGTIAVIPLHGVISNRMGGMTEISGGMSTERFAQMFRQAMADESVSAIVADIDSPGGTIAGVTELHAEIMAARGQKRLVAHVNDLGASAAYWIASAFEEVWATPSATVGSIGIIASHLDTSKADEQKGVTRTTFTAGKYKGEGHGPLTDEAKAAIQARLDEAYAVMTTDIGSGRSVDASAVKEGFGEGRVVSAKSAKKLAMIDKIGTFDELVGKLTGRRGVAAGMRAEDEAPALAADAELTAAEAAAAMSEEMRQRLERF